jgi:hypothetical protein
MSTMKKVREALLTVPVEQWIPVSFFLPLGPRHQVDQALSDLTKFGEIVRVGRGMYTRPVTPKVPENLDEVMLLRLPKGLRDELHSIAKKKSATRGAISVNAMLVEILSQFADAEGHLNKH